MDTHDEAITKRVTHRLITYLEDAYGVVPEATGESLGPNVHLDLVIDIGNSETYALAVIDGRLVKPIRLPSVKSVRRGMKAAALLAERGRPGDWRALGSNEHVVVSGGVERFVGQLAITDAVHSTAARGSEERYSDGWNLDFLYAAVGALTPGVERITARVITGLPYDLWGTHQEAVVTALKRRHEFDYNGQPKQITVKGVSVEREGHSAWWALPAAWRGGLVLVLDWGGHTCNILLVNAEGRIVNGMTQPVGYETILDDISAELPRPLTLVERAELQAAIRDGARQYLIPVGGDSFDALPVAQRLVADAATTFAQKLKATIPQQQRLMIGTAALVGGTTYAMAAPLTQLIPVLKTLPKEHEFANLLGNAIKHGLIGEKTAGRRGK